MSDLTSLTLREARERLDTGAITSRELTAAYLARIKERDGSVHAYLEVFDDALAQADAADARLASGERRSLLGIPMALKDNILVRGKIASAASRILENHRAAYDATVTRLLKEEGAVFLGRTNMDEFAMGSSTENSAFGPTKNPHDESRVPGGSSGGSAAAVAMGGALVALGSETGGSIRQPASFSGVVGLKTTYGAVSRFGLIALGSSLDQIGPLGKTVDDAKMVFEAISRHDPMDSTSVPMEKRVPAPSRGKVIGVPEAFLKEGVAPEVEKNFRASLASLERAGYEIRSVELPSLPYSLAVYYIILPAEASTNLARLDGIRYGAFREGDDLLGSYLKTRGEGFGKEPRRRIMLGTYVLSAGYYDAYYKKATAVRAMIERDFAEAFKEVSYIATPTSPTPAFALGAKSDPLEMYLADIFTVPANLAGVPAISVPSGTTADGLPVGIQFIAPHFSEDRLFEIGSEFEKLRAI